MEKNQKPEKSFQQDLKQDIEVDSSQSTLNQTESYPGIKGPKTRRLQHDSNIDRKEAEQVRRDISKGDGSDGDEQDYQSELELMKQPEKPKYSDEHPARPHAEGKNAQPLQPGGISSKQLEKSKESRNDQ